MENETAYLTMTTTETPPKVEQIQWTAARIGRLAAWLEATALEYRLEGRPFGGQDLTATTWVLEWTIHILKDGRVNDDGLFRTNHPSWKVALADWMRLLDGECTSLNHD